jgi:hypothetical protein
VSSCDKEGGASRLEDPACAHGALVAPMSAASDDGEPCKDPIPRYADGKVIDMVCPAQIAEQRLTVIELGDEWLPRVLRGDGRTSVSYGREFIAMAKGQLGEDSTWDRAKYDRFFELFGIFPAPSLAAQRLGDETRHRCHAAVEDAALHEVDEAIDTWRPLDQQRGDDGWARTLKGQLDAAARSLKLSNIDELAQHDTHGVRYKLWRKLVVRRRAIVALQEHLRCEGLMPKRFHDGLLDHATINALMAYHRRHMIISWQLDAETRRALLSDSRELDFRQLLRSLRERVTDATGLLEDGSAAGERGEVVGRVLDASVFLALSGDGKPLPAAAPDLISRATDITARALGWTQPLAAKAFFADKAWPRRVAVALPAPPAYHAAHMELRLVIDRGDVWYDFPYHPSGDRYPQPRERKPSTVLYAKHNGGEIPLMRWPTTVGGWHPEKLDSGRVMLAYKESYPGERIVRDLIAAPRWIPPESTPARDLVRPRDNGSWALRYDTFGPSYASAYGMVMLVHHRVDPPRGGAPVLTDQGIRTHGSASYDSILDGYSHGCHRLHNHRAVRLANFLLAHRAHAIRGELMLDYARRFAWRGKVHLLKFDSRGYRYELTPPLEVQVREGTLRGHSQKPQPPKALTRRHLQRYNLFGG